MPHEEPSNIAQDLNESTKDHSSHKAPCFIDDSVGDLCDQAQSIEGDKQRCEWQRNSIAIDGCVDGAHREGAVDIIATGGVGTAVDMEDGEVVVTGHDGD